MAKFVVSKFVISKFVISEFVISKFVVSKFVISECAFEFTNLAVKLLGFLKNFKIETHT